MDIFFIPWDSLLRIIVTGLIAYSGLILLLRIFGKRLLSKLNMFDFITTVAFGSTFAATVLQENVTAADGLLTFAYLLAAQYIITRSSLNWKIVNKLIKSQPTMVFHRGEFLEKAMQEVWVTKQEIISAIRTQGIASLDDVYAVVMETNGDMSVLRDTTNITNSTLQGVRNYDGQS